MMMIYTNFEALLHYDSRLFNFDRTIDFCISKKEKKKKEQSLPIRNLYIPRRTCKLSSSNNRFSWYKTLPNRCLSLASMRTYRCYYRTHNVFSIYYRLTRQKL